MPVLCPTVYPGVLLSQVADGRGLTLPAYGGYLLTFNDPGIRTADVGHVFLGGQPARFSLAGSPGRGWPEPGQSAPDREMRIHRGARVIRRAPVGSDPALILRVAEPYPAGGVHAEHVLVLWNVGGHGYLVSVHLRGGRGRFAFSERDRVNAALAIARSARPS